MTTIAGQWENASHQPDDTPRNRAVDALQFEAGGDPLPDVSPRDADPLTRELAAGELARTIRREARYLTLAERMVFAAALLPEFHEDPAKVGDLP